MGFTYIKLLILFTIPLVGAFILGGIKSCRLRAISCQTAEQFNGLQTLIFSTLPSINYTKC